MPLIANSKPTMTGPVAGEAITTLGAFDLGRHGYVSEEWLLEGTARSRRGIGEMGDDGLWATEEDSKAPYRTLPGRMPPGRSPAHFNGTVLVEWLNVSGGRRRGRRTGSSCTAI